MFIGHFAVAFAAKRAAPRTSLGVLFAGAQLADMLWPIFLLFGWERVRIAPSGNPFLHLEFEHYPWSHSLAMELVWGAALGLLVLALTRRSRDAIVVGLLVPSHWLLDFATHRPDMPLYPGSAGLGLSLWERPAVAIVVESIMFATGLALYASATAPRDRKGSFGLWALAAFLILAYVASLVSPPPPSVNAVAWGTLIGWPLMLFPWWVDRHRRPV